MNTEKVDDKIDELRDQIVATVTTSFELADMPNSPRTNANAKVKAEDQMIKLKDTWNNFLEEWQELKDKINKSEEFDKRTIEKGSKFSTLQRIAKKNKGKKHERNTNYD